VSELRRAVELVAQYAERKRDELNAQIKAEDPDWPFKSRPAYGEPGPLDLKEAVRQAYNIMATQIRLAMVTSRD
jgi:hypothetical protein